MRFSTTRQRSDNMRAIKAASNETTELRFRSLLVRNSISGWTLHNRMVLGNPDFFFESYRMAVFIDGCFWHGCPKCGHIPKTNASYWRKKILRNRKRDAHVRRKLRGMGYSVLRVWECDLKRRPNACLMRVVRAIAARS